VECPARRLLHVRRRRQPHAPHPFVALPAPQGLTPLPHGGACVAVYLVETIGYRVERQVTASFLRPVSCGPSSGEGSKTAPAAPATTNLGCGQAGAVAGSVAGAALRTSSRARVTSKRALSSCETW
jgi:hypothetical protein